MKLIRITPPASLPVTRDFAKAHSRVLGDAEDGVLDLYLAAATDHLDGPSGVVGRCFMTQTWQLELSGWMGPVGLRVEPVQSVQVFYTGADGNEAELPSASYDLDTGLGHAPTLSWIGTMPVLSDAGWPVRIVITAGQAEATPQQKVAVLMLAADLYERRESSIQGTIITANPAYDAIVTSIRRVL